ncbi:HutD/Ves family protein [Thalassotalea piscium]|uniref:HutD family protein n=1 Tax=Thalassotalea piscium TaxID=1230533 RepID=A0A7X0NIF8_9GAMM|nr:HutD family protein [Thalassotalea piscium]MBB6544024.1 hypothetical protein [Thalassotalea piscium]
MYLIKQSKDFITTPWKNGLGETTELAINNGGTLKRFDWRLSMAKVTKNGVFSNFEGYQRQLILINGNGIELTHKNVLSSVESIDRLVNKLDIAEFDGANETYGKLVNGEITDFNIITNTKVIDSKVQLITQQAAFTIIANCLLFIYSIEGEARVTMASVKGSGKSVSTEILTLAQGELFQCTTDGYESLEVVGHHLIVIQMTG